MWKPQSPLEPQAAASLIAHCTHPMPAAQRRPSSAWGREPLTTTAWAVNVGCLRPQWGHGSSASAEDLQPSPNVLKENIIWNKCSFMLLQETGI